MRLHALDYPVVKPSPLRFTGVGGRDGSIVDKNIKIGFAAAAVKAKPIAHALMHADDENIADVVGLFFWRAGDQLFGNELLIILVLFNQFGEVVKRNARHQHGGVIVCTAIPTGKKFARAAGGKPLVIAFGQLILRVGADGGNLLCR